MVAAYGRTPGRRPQAFDGQADERTVVPTGLVARKDLLKLFECIDEGMKRLVGRHRVTAEAAPGTSSVMTCT